MKTRSEKLAFICGLLLLSQASIAQQKPTGKLGNVSGSKEIEKAETPSGIVVDESNFKAIFNQSVAEESSDLSERTRAFDVELAASYSTLNDLALSNNYFSIDYANDFKSVPVMKFSMAKDVWSTSRTSVSGMANLGYGFKEARVVAESNRGTQLVDQIALQWIPLSAGVQIKQKIPGTQRFSAFAAPSLGSQYFHQSGNLDGIDQGYWVNFWNLRAGFVLFEQSGKKLGASFDGVVLGANLSGGLGSKQKFSSWSADLGMKFAL